MPQPQGQQVAAWYGDDRHPHDALEALVYLKADYDELHELARAFKSYLEDNSRSDRRRQACLAECNRILERLA